MPREADVNLSSKAFVTSALAQGLRVDGRSPLELRELAISFGRELGNVTIRLGKTTVLAHTSISLAAPSPERPYEGTLAVHTELSPMASPFHDQIGRASDEEVLLTRMVDKAIRRSGAVDREALCIVAGEKVWALTLTLHFLTDDGNLLDAAVLASILSLKHFRRPDVTVVGSEVTVHTEDERVPVPLAIHYTPICITFAFFESIPQPILDPTHLETQLATSFLNLALTPQRELLVVSKTGGSPLEGDEVMCCVGWAVERVREVNERIEKALKEDLQKRVLEVR